MAEEDCRISEREEIELLTPPPGIERLPFLLRRGEMLLDASLWSIIPYRVLLIVLEYIEVQVLRRRNYDMCRLFYGYFSLDRWRKIFLVFPSVCIRGEFSPDVPAPLQHIRSLRLFQHPDQVPSPEAVFPLLRRMTAFRGLHLPSDDPESLEVLPSEIASAVETLEISTRDAGLLADNDRLIRILNERFSNLLSLKLTTWKNDFFPDTYDPAVPLALPLLIKLSLFDFPGVGTPWLTNQLRCTPSLTYFRCVNCVVGPEWLSAVGENQSVRTLLLRRCVLVGGLRHVFARSRSIRDLTLRECRVEEDLETVAVVINDENRVEFFDASSTSFGNSFWSQASAFFPHLRSLRIDNWTMETVGVVEENANWRWEELVIETPKRNGLDEDVIERLVTLGASVITK